MSFFMPGGFGGFGGFGQPQEESEGEESNNTAYYETLGLKKNAKSHEIKKAYRKLARECHPDRHHGEEKKYQQKFQDLQKAYEVLSDPEKKKLYDRYGEAGISGAGSSGTDIFNMFFGGQGGRSRRQKKQARAPVVKQFLDVTLEDLYNGSTMNIEFNKMTVCDGCNGKGGSNVIDCGNCGGSGTAVKIQRMGNMHLQSEGPCGKCDGQGQTISPSDACDKCDMKGFIKKKKKLEVEIPKGCSHAEKIVLRGHGHEIPDGANGDVVVIVRCKKHDIFTRIGADLAMNYNIGLKEALCGYRIKIPHFNGKIITLKSKKTGDIINHDDMRNLKGYGMPQRGNETFHGNLYISFKLILPDFSKDNDDDEEMKDQDKQQQFIDSIRKILPKSQAELSNEHIDQKMNEYDDRYQKQIKAETNEAKLEQIHLEYEKMHETLEDAEDLGFEKPAVTPASSRSAYDEDEDEQPSGSGCRQM